MIEILNDHQVRCGDLIAEYPATLRMFELDTEGIYSIKIGEKETSFDRQIDNLLKFKDKWYYFPAKLGAYSTSFTTS